MKKAFVKILLLIGIGALAMVSCPDYDDHKSAIMEVVSGAIKDELQTSDENVLGSIFGSIGTGVAGYLLDNRLTVKDYYVCSIGMIKDADGVDQRVSVGVFGHVFTGDKEQLKEAISGK